MEELDADNKRLSFQGRFADRDIVQVCCMSCYSHHITFKLARQHSLAYKTLVTAQLSYLWSLIHQYRPIQTLCSTEQHLLEQPHISTDFCLHSAKCLEQPPSWNQILLSILLCVFNCLWSKNVLKFTKTFVLKFYFVLRRPLQSHITDDGHTRTTV